MCTVGVLNDYARYTNPLTHSLTHRPVCYGRPFQCSAATNGRPGSVLCGPPCSVAVCVFCVCPPFVVLIFRSSRPVLHVPHSPCLNRLLRVNTARLSFPVRHTNEDATAEMGRIDIRSHFMLVLLGSVAEWLACWTQAQKGPGSNRSRDAVG